MTAQTTLDITRDPVKQFARLRNRLERLEQLREDLQELLGDEAVSVMAPLNRIIHRAQKRLLELEAAAIEDLERAGRSR